MKKIYYVFTVLLLSFLLLGFPQTIFAAEKEQSLEITGEDIQNGVYVIPSGSYNDIIIYAEVLDAVFFLEDVKVTGIIELYGNGVNTPTFFVSGDSSIAKLVLYGNSVIISPDSKNRIRTISVRSGVRVTLKAAVKNYSVIEEADGAVSHIYNSVSNFLDQGKNNVHTFYDTVDTAKLCGFNNRLQHEGQMEKLTLDGTANRVSVCGNVQTITMSGENAVVSVDRETVTVKKIKVKSDHAKIVRKERVDVIEEKEKESTAPIACEYLFIGDSYTELLYRLGYLSDDMQALFAWGSAPKHWFTQGDKAVVYAKELDHYAPKNIVYLYGVNQAKAASNIAYSKKLLSLLLEKYPTATIYVQRVFPVGAGFSLNGYSGKDVNTGDDYNVTQLNRMLKEYCKTDERLIWIDTTDGLVDKNGNLMREKSKDNLHLTQEAYELWWQNILSEIQE